MAPAGADTLASPGARAILIGAASHAAGSALTDLPAVATTLDDVQQVLLDVCGMPPGSVHRVPAEATGSDVIDAVERVVADATGVVALYYVGHGLLGPGDELYLATHASMSARQIAQAISYRTIKDLLSGCMGGSVVVLDCCFSGRAAAPGGGRSPEPFATARPDGSFLLTSATHLALSFAPEGERHTLFSGRLIRLLQEGDPSGPLWLTMDRLHAVLDRDFREGPIRPRRQSEGTVGSLIVARNRAYRADAVPQPAAPADVPCPYPGMEPFRPQDRGHFFGRAELTERLLEAVTASVHGPVVLVGASGVGKSSLLRAGLLAELEQRVDTGRTGPGHSGSALWPALLLPAPGRQPLQALAALWAQAVEEEPEDVRQALADGRFPQPPHGRTACRMLVVDQFEEIFTRCEDGEERARFIAALTQDDGGPRVVLALRADHYGSCLAHPSLVKALERGQITIPPMGEEGLRAAVEGPAHAVGLTLEDGLVDRLLHDLRHGDDGSGPDGALPFLAHALRETWLRRSGSTLTLAGYQATGGIWRSVTTTTERLYRSLDDLGRQTLRDLLLHMIHLPPDGTGAVLRRPVPPSSLLEGLPADGRRLAADLLDRLADARLITVDRARAQISHEALLRAWPRLHGWIEEDRSDLVRRRRLSDAADAWQASGRDPAFHLQGTRLEAASESVRKARLKRQPMRHLDLAFVAASDAAARAERLREERARRRLKQALAGVALGLCLALVAALVAYRQRNTVQEQRELATYRALFAEAQSLRGPRPQTALRVGLAAFRMRPSAESRQALFDTLARTPFAGSSRIPGSAGDTVLSQDGHMLAATDSDARRVSLWNVHDAARPSRLAVLPRCGQRIDGMAFARDGRMLVTACRDGSLNLWSLVSRSRPRRLASLRVAGLPGAPGAVAFSHDGTRLAAAGWYDTDRDGGALALWDVRDQQRPRRLALRRGVYDESALVFGPDGRTLVSATSRILTSADEPDKDTIVRRSGATLWDITGPGTPRSLLRFDGVDETTAFSPDSRLLFTVDGGRVSVWDISTPAEPRHLSTWTADKEDLTALAVSPDGSMVASTGDDETVTLWNLADPGRPKRTATLSGHLETVYSLAFASDGRTLTSADSHTVSRWYAAGSGLPTAIARLTGDRAVNAVALTPDGDTLAMGGFQETVDVWDLTDLRRPRRIVRLRGHSAPINDIAISPDGQILASADTDGKVLLWNLANRNRPRKTATLPRSDHDDVYAVAFDPRGTTLVATGAKTVFSPGWATLWDVGNPNRPRELSRFSGLATTHKATFSPDGRLLSLPAGLETALWNRSPSSKPVVLPEGDSTSAFGPDSKTLATGNHETEGVILWDITDPAHPQKSGQVAGNHHDTYYDLSFHPSGNMLAAAVASGDTILWNVEDRTQPHVAATLTRHQREVTSLTFHPDGQHLITASGDSTVIVWDLGRLPAISADTIGMACAVAGGGLTEEEWQEHAPGLPYEDSCP
ncbi:caspase, EACC1-associated type [Streptomyces sp. NRRL B-3648]|uniref:caspase, EACC1-associated type n=1 Tax=Streptomyces sp. NRRL B-3648 TaxID=1519493 RepID=UPI0022772F27